jgi:cobalt transporter subunit CbtA
MRVVLLSGALAGAVLFVYQYFVMVPRILAAEAYEEAQPHEHHEWKPHHGFERNALTAASTILAGIGFAALLVSIAALTGAELTISRGALWGWAGFLCFAAAPALGLPPVPPGVAEADLHARQLWWLATAAATAIGLLLIFAARPSWLFRLAGVVLLLLPHLIGAPQAAGPPPVIPADLVREFAVASVAGNALFWVVLGMTGGWLLEGVCYNRQN